MHPFSAPEKTRKLEGFLIFPGSKEKVQWEQMGLEINDQ